MFILPECPYCGVPQINFTLEMKDDELIEDFICKKCNKKFDIICEIEISYECWKKEDC